MLSIFLFLLFIVVIFFYIYFSIFLCALDSTSIKSHKFIYKPLYSGISENIFIMIGAHTLGQLFLVFGTAFLFQGVYSVDIIDINEELISNVQQWIGSLLNNYSSLSLHERFQAFYYTEYLIHHLDVRWITLNSYVGSLETLGQDYGPYYDQLNGQAEDLRDLINDLTELYRNIELDLEIRGVPATEFED